tara:strand:+ start:920 stop:1240 length:321 start_codon:yes stop_codon:yes gene_type:complete
MSINYIIIILSLIVTETTALYFIQKAVKQHWRKNFILGILIYIFVPIFYFFLLKMGGDVGLGNLVFNTGSNISVLLMGYLFFSQKLTLTQFLGLATIILGTVIIKI